MELGTISGLTVYPRSVIERAGTVFFLARDDQTGKKWLGIRGDASGFERAAQAADDIWLCPLSAANAAALRARLPWLRPVPLGLQTSFGFGDRLGLATPGHVRAVRGTGIAPVFAQQSVRENSRTGRTPQQVLDEAIWGVFQEGWQQPWGADADHVKHAADFDLFIAAGYTLFTIDPGDHVDNAVPEASEQEVMTKLQALPWGILEDTLQAMEHRYLRRSFALQDAVLVFDREILWRAAAKYGRAIAHTVQMYRYLKDRMGQRVPVTGASQASSEQGFELEVSVDETATPTSPEEHFFIASELRRLGVHWVSLAPRFVGRFEKGVDYMGDLNAFETELKQHVAIAQALGPYKLSLHSGSDKLSVYPIFAHRVGKLGHIKTAGTSYLEALRTIAGIAPELFREILLFARQHYETDKATYHVSADLDRLPITDQLSDAELASVLDLFDGRQVLHVTFGSVLTEKNTDGTYRFRDRLQEVLQNNEERYFAVLQAHFAKHLAPFVAL
ncbi:MAG: tagaturonate epimerase family protein [Anaerolineae bacterium]